MKLTNILKYYLLFYIGYMFGTGKDIYNINIISVIFYILLIIEIFVLIHNEINK